VARDEAEPPTATNPSPPINDEPNAPAAAREQKKESRGNKLERNFDPDVMAREAGILGVNDSRGGSASGPVPRVGRGKAKIRGALDKDIVHRTVRAHFREVRTCYVKGLEKNPGLAGQVAIQFAIDGSGRVPVAKVGGSTVKSKEVGACIARAVETWKFPKPQGGGNVIVTYPFILVPGK